MTVLHVREQGAVVRRAVEQIRVTQKDKETRKQQLLAQAPVRELTQLVIYGNVQVTTQATALLLAHDVDLVFLSVFGKFRGRLTKSGSKFAQLRHAQLRFSGDDAKSLAVAKKIVQTKLANQYNTLQSLLANQPAGPLQQRLQRTSTGIAEMRRASSGARDADALRGFEGKAGAYYFEAIGSLLDTRWQFKGRNYYPAPDPFNALLSFGYALLLKDTTAALQLVGLDPYLGCFHVLEYGRPSLTLDLMEEFRPLAVDQVVLALVATGVIEPTHFTFTGRQARPVELGEALIPTVIEAYEERMSSTIRHTPSGNENTLRRCIELQARIFARVVMGERQEYEGVVA
ncbi:MAG: CRISPR-associated endonuclease Cas1 [Caldilineaceae bacterium]